MSPCCPAWCLWILPQADRVPLSFPGPYTGSSTTLWSSSWRWTRSSLMTAHSSSGRRKTSTTTVCRRAQDAHRPFDLSFNSQPLQDRIASYHSTISKEHPVYVCSKMSLVLCLGLWELDRDESCDLCQRVPIADRTLAQVHSFLSGHAQFK